MSLDITGIHLLVKEFDAESKAIKNELFKICWFMRGGISYTESHSLSYEDREIIGKIIEANLLATKESGLPFF